MTDWLDATDPVPARRKSKGWSVDQTVAHLSPETNLRLQVALVKRGIRQRISVNRSAGLDPDFDDMGA